MSKGANSIVVNFKQGEYTLKYGQLANELFFDLMPGQDDLQKLTGNPLKLVRRLFYIGLMGGPDRKKMPDGFTEDDLVDWMDDMEQEEYDKAKVFAMEALGFILESVKGLETALPVVQVKG